MRDRRWGRILGGVLLVLVGALASLGSLVALGFSSCDAYELSSEVTLQARSEGNAVVVPSDVLELRGPSSGFLSFCGADYDRLMVEAEAAGKRGRKVFLGTASPRAAARYLRPARYDRAYEDFLSVADFTFDQIGRKVRRIDPPGPQPLWFDRSDPTTEGTSRLRHSWTTSYGSDRSPPFWLALMNADGSPGIASEMRLHFEVPGPSPWPYVAVVLAGVLLVVGGVVLARSGRRLFAPPT